MLNLIISHTGGALSANDGTAYKTQTVSPFTWLSPGLGQHLRQVETTQGYYAQMLSSCLLENNHFSQDKAPDNETRVPTTLSGIESTSQSVQLPIVLLARRILGSMWLYHYFFILLAFSFLLLHLMQLLFNILAACVCLIRCLQRLFLT